MKIYLRILRYLRPHWSRLAGSIVCVLFFVIFSSVSLVSLMPFLSTIFEVEQEAVPAGGAAEQMQQSLDKNIGLNIDKEALKDKLYSFFLGEDWKVNRMQSLHRICLLLVIIIFFRGLFGYLQSYLMAYVEQGVIRDLRNDIYRHIHRLSLGYFNQTRTGQLISRITNDVTLVNGGLSASFFTLIKNPLLIVASLVIAFLISWQLTLAAFIILPFSLFIIGGIGLRLRRDSAISQQRMADVTSVLQETISGARIVKAFGMEEFEYRKFAKETSRFFRTMVRLTRIRNLASPITEFLGTLVAVAILWYGGSQVLAGGELSASEFITFILVIFSIMQPVKEISTVNNRIQEAVAAGKRIFELMDTKPEIKESPRAKAIDNFREHVCFQGVSFAYNDGPLVLKNIDLGIEKGQLLAIVGPSGAGKSTLVDLIPRFYDPVEGVICIDGVDIRLLKIYDLRSLLGIVTQETILFNDTIRNNIAYGEAAVPLEKVMEAARVANAHDFIQEMEKGYDTIIGERGVKLSGGQRQRLSIARAVLKNPPILILDEATSSLDTESEILVQEAIDRLMENRTSFVIAHRLSTVQHAQKIVVLDQGRLVEEGTHQQLLRRGGIYRRLHEMQFRTPPEEGRIEA